MSQLLAPRQPVQPVASRRRGTAHADDWVIPDEAVDDPGFDLAGWFGRAAPLVVEIGSGVGRGTGALAGARARPRRAGPRGVAARGRRALGGSTRPAPTNVRLLSVDAVWAMRAPVRARVDAGALDVLPRPVAQDAAPQAAAGAAGVRRAAATRLRDRAPVAAGHRLGATTPSRCAPCSTPSRCWPGAWSSAGRSARSPGSSARASRPAGPITDLTYRRGVIPQGGTSSTRPARDSSCSTRSRSWSSSGPGGSTPAAGCQPSAAQASPSTASYDRSRATIRAALRPSSGCRTWRPRRRTSDAISWIGRPTGSVGSSLRGSADEATEGEVDRPGPRGLRVGEQLDQTRGQHDRCGQEEEDHPRTHT